jgi:phosphatidylinositol glycan class V
VGCGLVVHSLLSHLLRSRRAMSVVTSVRAANILCVATASRALAVLFAVVSNALIPDHEPEGALLHTFPPECQRSGGQRSPLLSAFTRWDAAHFLSLASNGWTAEYSHAFFPLYPLLVRLLADALMRIGLPLCATEARVLSGILISNCAFLLAAWCLRELGEHVLRHQHVAHTAALVFCFSPASVFFSTAYSESTFAAASFGGMLLIERQAPWAGSLALAVATGCRANGVLNALYVAVSGLRRLHSLSLPPRRSSRRTHLIASLPSSRLEAACVVCTVACQCALVVAPYVGWQVAGYHRACAQHPASPASWLSTLVWQSPSFSSFAAPTSGPTPTRRAQHLAASGSTLPPGWCDTWLPPPDLYAHVQRTYWGVGLLQYYTWRQLPNFALAAPSLVLCAVASTASLSFVRKRCTRMRWHDACGLVIGTEPLGRVPPSRLKWSTDDAVLTPRALPYMFHWLMLSALSLAAANVQVTTRLVFAACPPAYWCLAHLLLPVHQDDGRQRRAAAGGTTAVVLGSPWLRACVLPYIGAFTVLGTLLHSNFYPWT